MKNQRFCPVCNSKIEIKKVNGMCKKLDDEDAIIPNHGLQVSEPDYIFDIEHMRNFLFL